MNLVAEHAPQHFSNRSSAPITLICGAEPLLNIEAVNAWRACIAREGYSERQSIDADSSAFQWRDLPNEYNTPSLFARRRSIEIYSDSDKLSDKAIATLTALSAQRNDNIRLLLYIPELNPSPKSKWYQTLFLEHPDNCTIHSKALYPNTFARQIDQRLQQAELRLSPDARQRLLDYCQGNLLAAQQAIQRLTIHPQHDSIIDNTMLGELLADVSQFSVFALSDAILSGQWLDAWKIAGKLRTEYSDQSTLVTWLIQRDMNILLHLHSQPHNTHSAIFSQYKIRSNFQHKRYQQATKRFPPRLIRNTLKLCAKLDRIDKGGESGDYWLTLSQYLLLLAQNRRNR